MAGDDLTAWLLILVCGAGMGPLVSRGMGWVKTVERKGRKGPRRAPMRKLRLASALLVLVAGLSFGPTNCVQKAAAELQPKTEWIPPQEEEARWNKTTGSPFVSLASHSP